MANKKRRISINGKRLKELMANYSLCRPQYIYENLKPEEVVQILDDISSEIKDSKNSEYISIKKASSIVKNYGFLIDKRELWGCDLNFKNEIKRETLLNMIHYSRYFLYKPVPEYVGDNHLRGHITIEQLANEMSVDMSTVKDWRKGEIAEDSYLDLCSRFHITKRYLKNDVVGFKHFPYDNLSSEERKSLSQRDEFFGDYWKSLNRLDSNLFLIDFYEEFDQQDIVSEFRQFLSFGTKTKYLSEFKEEINKFNYAELQDLSNETMLFLRSKIDDYVADRDGNSAKKLFDEFIEKEGKDNGKC